MAGSRMINMKEHGNSSPERGNHSAHIEDINAAIDSVRSTVASLPTRYDLYGNDLIRSSDRPDERKDSLHSSMREVLAKLSDIHEKIGSLNHPNSNKINKDYEGMRLLEAIENADLRAALIRAQEASVFKGLAMNQLEQRLAQLAQLQSHFETRDPSRSFAERLEMVVNYIENMKSKEHYQRWVKSFNTGIENKDRAENSELTEIKTELEKMKIKLDLYKRQAENIGRRSANGETRKLFSKLRFKINKI